MPMRLSTDAVDKGAAALARWPENGDGAMAPALEEASEGDGAATSTF